MIQYEDLSMSDIQVYWQAAILLLPREGKYHPCQLRDIEGTEIHLRCILPPRQHVVLSRREFLEQVVIHHPTLGYGDYKGVPIFLSSRAGRGRNKGVVHDHLAAMCPIDWSGSIKQRIDAIRKEVQKTTAAGGSILPSTVQEYTRLTSMSIDTSVISTENVGRIYISSVQAQAEILWQSVNNTYPTMDDAVSIMQSDKERFGISLSKDVALLRNDSESSVVYHRMTPVGTLLYKDLKFVPDSSLSQPAQKCVSFIINSIGA